MFFIIIETSQHVGLYYFGLFLQNFLFEVGKLRMSSKFKKFENVWSVLAAERISIFTEKQIMIKFIYKVYKL